jgi:hypothetical protein
MAARIMMAIGWLLAVPGLVLGLALTAVLLGLPEAAGCAPDRLFAVRCPEGVIGTAALDLHDLGMIVLLAPQVALLPMLYAAVFVPLRLAFRLVRTPAARGLPGS